MRVVLTFARGTLPGLAESLRAMGFDPAERPLISFEPPPTWGPLDDALRELDRYTAIAVTSRRGAQAVADRLRINPPNVELWAAGPASAEPLASRFAAVRLGEPRAKEGAGASLARAMIAAKVRPPVLYPCGDRRRDELIDTLTQAGITIDARIAYRTVLAEPAAARAAIAAADILVIASPSVARLAAAAAANGGRPALVAVGPTTAGAAREVGWPPAGTADRPLADVVAEVVRALG